MTHMLPKTGRYDFVAEPFHCDFSLHLFPGHLGNAMLNAADFHSNDRGFGMSYLSGIHKTWVLSRFALEMTTMPKAYDKFAIETWVDGAMRFFTSRNFAVSSPDGATVYGYGRSIWAMIDTVTRQPVDLLQVHDGLIQDYVETEKACPIAKPSRVRIDQNAVLRRCIDTCYSDIDVNGHVNSVKYIDHILDLWGMDWYESHDLRRLEIAYVAESHQGDRLSFYVEETAGALKDAPGAVKAYSIRVTKCSPGSDEETEVVRAAVLWNGKA